MGVLVLGDSSVTYVRVAGAHPSAPAPGTPPSTLTVALDPPSRMLACAPVDSTRMLLGDAHGRLLGLQLERASFRDGLTGIGGITVDETHVYWTQNDGRVYRAPKE